MSHRIAVVDAVVVDVNAFGSGTLKIYEPLRSQLGFGYALFDDDEVQTLPMILTVGREVRCEVWTPVKVPGKHHARNIWVYLEVED